MLPSCYCVHKRKVLDCVSCDVLQFYEGSECHVTSDLSFLLSLINETCVLVRASLWNAI